ncbi:Hsp33 family molecular chaperone HslO [Derxia gummosa]|uniref:Hsp33 family molecular chaperone HslO n=1 Tax=Derxia gummosa DSM 723 TaxID=1121388 RepID=A0A8B6X7A6_9BURK|nr:Hsp33 family molecular chaperone HslO [Derxia gummosa]
MDELRKLIFDTAPVRGELVTLDETWRHVVGLHDYPVPVRDLLGEMLAASVLLSSTLKFDGSLVIQLFGDGPVKLLVAECDSTLGVRATARLGDSAVVADDATLRDMVNVGGTGRMSITLDPRNRQPHQQPYQGIVPLEGDNLAQVLEGYMTRSEQIDSRLWLACDGTRSTGLLMQRMPAEGGAADLDEAAAQARAAQFTADLEAWSHLQTLSDTVTREELLALAPEDIARRLFWDEQARILPARPVRFSCACSRERVGRMLRSLGREEIDSIVAEMGAVAVNCEYCNSAYRFDSVDVAQLFAAPSAAEGIRESGEQRH